MSSRSLCGGPGKALGLGQGGQQSQAGHRQHLQGEGLGALFLSGPGCLHTDEKLNEGVLIDVQILNKYHDEVAKREALAKSSKEEIEALRKEGEEAAEKANSQVINHHWPWSWLKFHLNSCFLFILFQLVEMQAKYQSSSQELQEATTLVGTLREQISQLEATIEARDAQIQELNTTHAAEV